MLQRTYRYRLFPSPSQTRLLDSTLEACRHFYNDCLAERKMAYEQGGVTLGKYAQLRQVKVVRATNPWAKNVHSHVLQTVVQDLDKAFVAFFRRVKAGEKPGYPRFKGRNRWRSFGFKEYGNGFKIDGRRLRLSGIGRVAVRWHRPVEGQIKTARSVKSAGKWFVSFSCVVETPLPLPPAGGDIGVDVGLLSLVTMSDGEKVKHPRFYRDAQRKLRIVQRSVARKTKGAGCLGNAGAAGETAKDRRYGCV